mgnify:CR=1 FL=1
MHIQRFSFSPVLNLLFPDICLGCSAAPARQWGLCQDCLERAVPEKIRRCGRCASAIGAYETESPCARCRNARLSFDRAFAVTTYRDLIRKLICSFKYGSDYALRRPLAEMFGNPAAEVLVGDMVVPVPLHWTRRLFRGFNQSEVLAGALAGRKKMPCFPRLLRRTVRTPHQAGLSHTARISNVRDAFTVRKRFQDKIRGKDILLVDDVMTTGATCSSCASALKKQGAASVTAVVLAR